jgi:hypothetical protein
VEAKFRAAITVTRAVVASVTAAMTIAVRQNIVIIMFKCKTDTKPTTMTTTRNRAIASITHDFVVVMQPRWTAAVAGNGTVVVFTATFW